MQLKVLLRQVLADIKEPMEQAVVEHCGRYTRDIESHAVSIVMASEEEMKMKEISLEQSDIWFREYGCTVCYRPGMGFELTDCVKGTTGSGVQIWEEDCQKVQGRPAGTFHTHPYGGAAPSVGDLMNVFADNRIINFIGGIVGGRKVILGYAPRPDSMMKWEMKQRIAPYRSAHTAATEYVVQFAFRMPESPDDLSIERYDVFSEEKEMINFMDNVDYLKTIFDVIVHWF